MKSGASTNIMLLLPGILYGEKIPWSKILNFAGRDLKEIYILCGCIADLLVILDEKKLICTLAKSYNREIQLIDIQGALSACMCTLWFFCYMVQMYHKLREKLYWYIHTQHSAGCHHKCEIQQHTAASLNIVHTTYLHMCVMHASHVAHIVKAV